MKVEVNNKLKGAYGLTHFKDGKPEKVVINKKAHKSKRNARVNKNKDGTESMIGTVFHEFLHVKHPKMKEKTVRKKTASKLKTMGKKEKQHYYNKINK